MALYVRNPDGTYSLNKPFVLAYGNENVVSGNYDVIFAIPLKLTLDTRNTPNIRRISLFGQLDASVTYDLTSTSGSLTVNTSYTCHVEVDCTGVSGWVYTYSSNSISSPTINTTINSTTTYTFSGLVELNAVPPEPITNVTIKIVFGCAAGSSASWTGTWNYIYKAHGNPLVLCMTLV